MNASPPIRPRVVIVLVERHWAGSVQLARELLQLAGTLASRSTDPHRGALFDIALAAPDRRPVPSFGGGPTRPEVTLDRAGPADVVIVPAQFAPGAQTSAAEARIASWLLAQHARGALVVSLAGAVLLAKAGLLDRREATGLLSERELFRSRFPLVRFLPGRRIVAAGDIVTACGIGPTPDACAHVVERFHGAALARRFLRHAGTEALPPAEASALWSARFKRHRDAPVLAVQELVERELAAVPPLAELAAAVGLSERTLSRRLHAATGLALRGYVAELRLARAQALLRQGDRALIHVALDCGFGSTAALGHAFAARFGTSPAAFRRAHAPSRDA